MRVIFMATHALNEGNNDNNYSMEDIQIWKTKKTFTQEELDSIIEGRLARERQKYADYEDLRAKASKYDEYQEQSKTELQKEKEKSDALQAKLTALEKEGTVRQVREKSSERYKCSGRASHWRR